MPLPTGAPDPQTIIYAIQRGEYDLNLALIAHAVRRRREQFDRIGMIRPSKGDYIEIWGEDDMDIPVPRVIRGARLRVVGFAEDKKTIRGRLEESRGKYQQGKVLKIDPEWVYRVHYYA